MNSNRSRLLFVGISIAALFFLTALKAPITPPGQDPMLKPLTIFAEVFNLTRDNYVEPINTENLLDGAYDGITDAIDPFSYYISGAKMARYKAFQAAHAAGPGLILGRRSGVIYVVAPVPGSPAQAAGIQTGDLVLEVNGVSTRNESLWEVEAALDGVEGSSVRLKMLEFGKDGETELAVERRRTPPPLPSERVDKGIPVVRIPDFEPGSASALKKEIGSLSGESQVILDVRGCVRGDYAEAITAASFFIPSGDVTFTSRKKEKVETFTTSASRIWKGKTVVLTDGGTAGPAEVFAGALHDRGAAQLVGEPTAGMGIVQKMIPTSSGGALYLTVAAYHSPSAVALTGKGLAPDTRVDIFPGDTAGGNDPILNRAIESLGSPAAKKTAA